MLNEAGKLFRRLFMPADLLGTYICEKYYILILVKPTGNVN